MTKNNFTPNGLRLMVTGHRPPKLGGYGMNSPLVHRIDGQIRKHLDLLRPTIAITGMALGVDQLFCVACLDKGIPVHAYIPFKGQESRWPTQSQIKYRALLAQCKRVIVCADSPSKSAFHLRNSMMVKACDQALVVWDGSPGGTASTVSLIGNAELPIIQISI